MLSKQAISDYKKIYKAEFGVELTDAEASEQSTKLLRIFRLIYKPISREWLRKEKKDGKS